MMWAHTLVTIWQKEAALRLCFIGVLIVNATVLSSCGGGAAQRAELTQCHQLKSYPKRDYLTAQSDGSTIEEARRRAITQISRRVSAEVRSLVELSGETQGDQSSEKVTEQIEVSTHFKYAELFKPLASCEGCGGELCLSTVVLSRDQAATRIIQDMGEALQLLSAATQDLREETPLLRFTQAWRRAQEARTWLLPLLNQVRALGRETPSLRGAEKTLERASQVRALRDKRLWVQVLPLTLKGEPISGAQREALQDVIDGRFSEALGALKIKRWTEPACPSSDGESLDVIMIAPSGALRCALGFVGPECHLTLGVNVTLCPQKLLTQDEWGSVRLVGVHPRETQRAISELIRSIQKSDISEALAKSLSPFLIL